MGLVSIKKEIRGDGENFLLLIGIDNYVFTTPLKNCVRDVKSLAEVLTTRYNFKYENLKLLTNEEATRKNIYAAFLDLINKLNPNDSIIIYYAGMGYYNGTNKEAYLIPVDGSSLSLDTCIELAVIENWLNSFQSKHVIFISDSDKSFNLLSHGFNNKRN